MNRLLAKMNRGWLIETKAGEALITKIKNASEEMESDYPVITLPEPIIQNGLATLEVKGILGPQLSDMELLFGGYDTLYLQDKLIQLRDNPEVEKIVLFVNSPGGEVTSISETGQLIAEVNQVKPIISYVDVMCASAALWLTSNAYLYAAPSSNVGSCGVYALYFDYTDMYNKSGVKLNPISAGKYKLMGSDLKVMTDEEKGILQSEVTEIHNEFKDVLIKNRDIQDRDYSLEGMIYSGKKAAELNLVDGTFNTRNEFMQFVINTNFAN
jgi:protease-4